MELPKLIRRGKVKTMLNINDDTMTKLVDAGAIKPVHLPGCVRAFYLSEQVVKFKNSFDKMENGHAK